MEKIKNPILPGFHADPCICRRDQDYYMALSSFEWFPGIPVYHSKDLKNWELLTHCLADEKADLRRLLPSKGVWAPCLTWCETDGLFYLVYSIMNSTNARFFDVDNFLITAPDICGPWSSPTYLHSAGFDASLFYDDNGKKWVVSLEWETRDGHEKPGAICLVEYDCKKKMIVGLPKRIWRGGTDRGCIEGPHIYKRNGYYYILCAEGGTGYGHCVTMGRSKTIDGPYERDPQNPILTSTPDFYGRHNDEAMKLDRYNPTSVLQKSGHGSIVETQLGEVYMVHHCGRPFLPELRCTLGREACIQKMAWTEDGWLRLAGSGNMAQEYMTPSALPEYRFGQSPARENFDTDSLPIYFYSLRINPKMFSTLTERSGWLRLRGEESLSSLNQVSLIARKLTLLDVAITTKLEFDPEVYQQYAGLVLYYDNMNYLLLRKTYNDSLPGPVIDLLRLKNGERHYCAQTPVKGAALYFRMTIAGRETQCSWSYDGLRFDKIGSIWDTSEFSDEYCKYGEFTGTFVGLCCVDALYHKKCADFDFFEYREQTGTVG